MTPPSLRSTERGLDEVLPNRSPSLLACDAAGVCVAAEGAALCDLGPAPGGLVGQNLWDVYAGRPRLVERMRRALDGRSCLEHETVAGQDYDSWYLALQLPRTGGTVAVRVSVDVTGRAVTDGTHRLHRAFIDAAPQFVALARLDGRVLFVNPGGRALAGIPDDVDVSTTTISDYLTPEGLAASLEVEQPAVIADGAWTGETTLRHWPTGEAIPVQVSSFLVKDVETGEPLALATVQSDIREVVAGREAVQRQLAHQRGLLHHLHEAQEAERQRIAADIHDDTVQVMAAVHMRLQALRHMCGPELSPERLADLHALVDTVHEATARLRRLLLELDQPVVDDEDVAVALRRVADASRAAGGPVTAVEVDEEVQPSPVVSRALVRIAHEALANVRRHARGATRAEVALRQEAGQYSLRIADDGPGLSGPSTAATPPPGGHRGIRGMTERAESVGGTLSVSGRVDGGVVVEARLPHLLGHPGQLAAPDPRVFLEQVMETIGDCYCAIDSQWRYVFMNRAGYQLLRRDPADSVVGRVIWDEFDIAPEFAAAYRRARDEHVQVEVTGYHADWDVWIYNRILPTAGGLSIFARDVSDEMRTTATTRQQERGHRTVLALGRALAAGGSDQARALKGAADAVVGSWPVRGLRITWPGGAVESGDLAGPARRVALVAEGVELGVAEVAGEVDGEEVDAEVLDLLALRLSAAGTAARAGS